MSGARFITHGARELTQGFIDRLTVELNKFEIARELRVFGFGITCADSVRVRLERPVGAGTDYVEETVPYCELDRPEARNYIAFHLAHDLLAVLLMPRKYDGLAEEED